MLQHRLGRLDQIIPSQFNPFVLRQPPLRELFNGELSRRLLLPVHVLLLLRLRLLAILLSSINLLPRFHLLFELEARLEPGWIAQLAARGVDNVQLQDDDELAVLHQVAQVLVETNHRVVANLQCKGQRVVPGAEDEGGATGACVRQPPQPGGRNGGAGLTRDGHAQQKASLEVRGWGLGTGGAGK